MGDDQHVTVLAGRILAVSAIVEELVLVEGFERTVGFFRIHAAVDDVHIILQCHHGAWGILEGPTLHLIYKVDQGHNTK